MTMTAREAMQALLDGKVVVTDGHTRYVLNDKGYIGLDHGPIREEPCGSFLNSVVKVIEGYPLTFEQALREMLDGKVVESQRCNNPTRFHEGRFEYLCDDTWFFTDIHKFEQESKWKVVE